jgi:hypothetical protein
MNRGQGLFPLVSPRAEWKEYSELLLEVLKFEETAIDAELASVEKDTADMGIVDKHCMIPAESHIGDLEVLGKSDC